MKTTTFPLLLLSCCIVANGYYHEVDRLHEFIESQILLKSIREQSWNLTSTQDSPIYVGSQVGLMEADKIDALPGQPPVNFDQYAGYVTVDSSTGRALFYYFVESPQDASTKPLVLWLNGGPGCSSFIGAMMELGPFRVYRDGRTLYANEYAWNNVANVIFLESPAGVGFSYSNTSSDYKLSGDKRTADDSYTFLVNWLERFPQYKNRDFYITGESYAGHYIPQLANTIQKHNKNADNTVINLKGIAIGNGYMDGNINTKAVYDYCWGHALISNEAYKEIQSKCSFANGNYSNDCTNALRSASAGIGRIDGYNIYAPLCQGASGSIKSVKEYDPCSSSYADAYLNHPEVQKALHANVTGLPYPWSMCSSVLRSWNDAPETLLPTIQNLIATGLRVWLYSGDQDAVCPVTSTKDSIDVLELPVESAWRPWYTNKEVGGYVVGYKGLTFATVRAAGHLVPTFQPERALTMITSFLEGQLPPSA